MQTTDKIAIHLTERSRLGDVDIEHAPFGRVFTDHMLVSEFKDGEWRNTRIEPYGPLTLSPATMALHYGQEIFEGMKAYRWPNGEVYLFRPEMNFERMVRSAHRMSMPALTEEVFLDGIKKMVSIDKAWVPSSEGSALYLRPFMIATDECVGVRSSDNYLFMVIACPVVSYYDAPFKVLIDNRYSRAANGGTGEAKCAGNYAASLYPARLANEKGYRQILWTDSATHEYVEESGTMNVFFVIDGVVVTPSLNGSILAGITRDSILTLLKEAGHPVEERPVKVEELIKASQEGRLEECFGAGTAATIAIITAIGTDKGDLQLPDPAQWKYASWIKDEINNIRTGRTADKFGWMVKVN